MKNLFLISSILLVIVCSFARVNGDLLDCSDEKKLKLPNLSDIGPKIASDEDDSETHEVRDFFHAVGCQIKKGATKVAEKAKKLGVELKEKAKELGEKARDLSSDIKVKYNNFKQKLSKGDTREEYIISEYNIPDSVEIINPDVLKGEQICGHGHLLDALGNCSKLRK